MVKSIGTFERIGRKMDNAVDRVKQFAKSEKAQKMIIAAKIAALVAASVLGAIALLAASGFACLSVMMASATIAPPLLLLGAPIGVGIIFGGIGLTLMALGASERKFRQLQLDYNNVTNKSVTVMN